MVDHGEMGDLPPPASEVSSADSNADEPKPGEQDNEVDATLTTTVATNPELGTPIIANPKCSGYFLEPVRIFPCSHVPVTHAWQWTDEVDGAGIGRGVRENCVPE
jgi:hypothetical protein